MKGEKGKGKRKKTGIDLRAENRPMAVSKASMHVLAIEQRRGGCLNRDNIIRGLGSNCFAATGERPYIHTHGSV